MLKNYFKLTFKLLKRKKVFSIITILGIAIPLFFLILIINFILHISTNRSPQSQFDKVLYFNEMEFSIGREKGMSGNMTSNPTYDFIKNHIKPMEQPAAIGLASENEAFNLYMNGKKNKLVTKYTDDGFWTITDFNFSAGRSFNQLELNSSQLVAVIDSQTKKLAFGDDDAIGKTLKIFKKSYIVIGVVKNADVTNIYTYANIWLPVTTSEKYALQDIFGYGCNCFLMAKTTDQIPLIEQEFNRIINNFDLGSYEGLTEISGALTQETFNSKLKNILERLFNIKVNEDYVVYIVYLVIIIFFLFLPAINLLYIHSSRINERSSEIGVRKSFGSTKSGLSFQFVFENIVITVLSGLLSLVLAIAVLSLINYSEVVPGLHIHINWLSLVLCMVLWIVFGTITGIIPAYKTSKLGILDAIHQRDLQSTFSVFSIRIKRLKLILVAEFLITFVTLAAILLFVFRFYRYNKSPLGFDYKDVYQVSVQKYDAQPNMFFFGNGGLGNQEVEDRIKNDPMVIHYGKLQWNEPYHSGYTTIDGPSYNGTVSKEKFHLTKTDENIDDVLNFNIVQGRWFDQSDIRDDYYPVVLNQQSSHKIFGDKNPVGQSFESSNSRCKVIGVVDQYKYHGELSQHVNLIFTLNMFNSMSVNMQSKVSTDFFRVKPGTSIEDINNLAKELSLKYPDYEINITSLQEVRKAYFKKTIGPLIVVSSIFILVMLIVLMGLFGVLWYDISQRKPEIGIRRSVGASAQNISVFIVKEMFFWCTLGIFLGIQIFIQFPLLKVLVFDWNQVMVAIFFASLIMYSLVLLCTLLPARQASKLKPALALHEDG